MSEPVHQSYTQASAEASHPPSPLGARSLNGNEASVRSGIIKLIIKKRKINLYIKRIE